MNQPIVKSQRIDVVDALRGFAVLAILLVVFATINAAFFPAGDVLLLFAIVGVVLFFARNFSDKVVLLSSSPSGFILPPSADSR